jgi:Chain length determinant protein
MNKASNELEIDKRNLQYVMMDRPNDDEISLIDLWLVLVKRKKVFFYIILASIVIGLFAAFLLPVKYEYSTSIEIGTRSGNVAIEPTQSVLAKLQEGYIPLALSSYNTDAPEETEILDIKSSVAKGSDIIRLSVVGIEHDEKIYIQLLNDVVEKIKADHKRVSSLVKNDLLLGIKRQENISSKLINEFLLMQSQMKRLDKKEQLLNKRIESLSEFVGSNEKLRLAASKNKEDQGATLTLMMLDNELRSGRELLAKLEDQSYLSLANEREVLRNQMSVNEKRQLENEQIVDKHKAELDNMSETRAIVKPLKSPKSVGMSNKLVLILFVVAGFMLSLISVFIMEFLENVKTAQLAR